MNGQLCGLRAGAVVAARGGTDGRNGRAQGPGGYLDPPALRRTEWEQAPVKSRAEGAAEFVAHLAASVERGSRLGTKDELRVRCGVSVGTFNEALRLLLVRGVVTVRPGSGGGLFAAEQNPMVRLGNSVLALDASQADVTEALRIRGALEPLLWQDALWHASPADVRDLRVILKGMREAAEAGDADTFVRANWSLHRRVADVAPNALLRSLYTNLLDLVASHAVGVQPGAGLSLDEYVLDRYRQHAAMVDALDKRDEAALMRHVADHDSVAGGVIRE
ncbi:FadR/GntR family transcriptional regulator [Streptomyces sp. NPDC059568]|uniref:FadR/GntR family transcriptional regulator n=1 Tax=unclassified Streptomyces TaxID=2593676 RepID=UPI003652FFD0